MERLTAFGEPGSGKEVLVLGLPGMPPGHQPARLMGRGRIQICPLGSVRMLGGIPQPQEIP